MKEQKRGASFKASISITLTALVAGFALSFLNSALADDIASNQQKATMDAINVVIPNATKIEGPIVDGDVSYYKGFNAKGNIAGFAMLSSEVGYGGNVPVIVGYDSTVTTITTIAILDNLETPNIGSKIKDKPFINSFDGGSSKTKFRIVKGGETDTKNGVVNSITGATVSSSVVVLVVNKLNDYITKNRTKILK